MRRPTNAGGEHAAEGAGDDAAEDEAADAGEDAAADAAEDAAAEETIKEHAGVRIDERVGVSFGGSMVFARSHPRSRQTSRDCPAHAGAVQIRAPSSTRRRRLPPAPRWPPTRLFRPRWPLPSLPPQCGRALFHRPEALQRPPPAPTLETRRKRATTVAMKKNMRRRCAVFHLARKETPDAVPMGAAAVVHDSFHTMPHCSSARCSSRPLRWMAKYTSYCRARPKKVLLPAQSVGIWPALWLINAAALRYTLS